MGTKEVCVAYHSPRRSRFVECLIGSIRREGLDHVIVVNEAHLMRILTSYFESYHAVITQSQTSPCTPNYGVS